MFQQEEIKKIPVLDHGYIRLLDCMGSDIDVIRAARVSYDSAWRSSKKEGNDNKLLKYLWKNNHSSPFEHVVFKFEVFAPILVFRQWHRHRTQSYNELSGRYRELERVFYVPSVDVIGIQSKDNKQARDMVDPTNDHIEAIKIMERSNNRSFDEYERLLELKIPRELARSVLPVSTYSHMFCTGNLLNFLKFLTLRLDIHAQYEIRQYACEMRKLMKPIVPVTIDTFDDFLYDQKTFKEFMEKNV